VDDKNLAFEELRSVYPSLRNLHPCINAELGIFEIDVAASRRRKATGSYYTPAALIDVLLDAALDPLLDEAAGRATSEAAQAAILDLKVCDPACGSGHFLVAAARRIARRLATVRSGGEEPSPAAIRESLGDVVAHGIFGVDIDPRAVDLTKINLWLECRKAGGPPSSLEQHLQCGNSLFFPWRQAFPQVFFLSGDGRSPKCGRAGGSGGFDVLVGNPPFVNVIRGGIPDAVKKRLAVGPSHLGGTADLAFHFVSLAHRLTRPGGRIGLVQPKTFLNAESAGELREILRRQRPPSRIYVPRRATFFPNTGAYVCLLVLGGGSTCSVSDDECPQHASWTSGQIADGNWWRSTQAILRKLNARPACSAVRLGERFEVQASMTAGDAYQIKAALQDNARGPGLKLITTGLIDPFACKWGRVECRYLGRLYTYPRVSRRQGLPSALDRRLRKAARPKLLIAGLCNRLEAYLDAAGQCVGAVSTFSVFHPADSLDDLSRLCRWLNSPAATRQLRAELGAASVGGDYMTVKKKTLAGLMVPLGSTGGHTGKQWGEVARDRGS
jgi:methylase of polypeptide subunit release factors